MSALGQKQTFAMQNRMKADIERFGWNVSLGPIADIRHHR
jgi:hypothetical protein